MKTIYKKLREWSADIKQESSTAQGSAATFSWRSKQASLHSYQCRLLYRAASVTKHTQTPGDTRRDMTHDALPEGSAKSY